MRTTLFEIEKRLFFLIEDEKKRADLINMIIRYAEECKTQNQLYLSNEICTENESLHHKIERLTERLEIANMKNNQMISFFKNVFYDELED